MKERVNAAYHWMIVEDTEMTERSYQIANWANFFLGSSIVYGFLNGFDVWMLGLAVFTGVLYYLVQKNKRKVVGKDVAKVDQ